MKYQAEPRTTEEVANILVTLYQTRFGGKENQRFLIDSKDLAVLFNSKNLFYDQLEKLIIKMMKLGYFTIKLPLSSQGYIFAILKYDTIRQWRKVPELIISDFKLSEITFDSEKEDWLE